MRLEFANGRQVYPLFQGGEGISTEYLARQFTAIGDKVRCFGKFNPPQRPMMIEEVDDFLRNFPGVEALGHIALGVTYMFGSPGFKNVMVDDKSFIQALTQEVDEFQPNAVVTQLDESHRVIETAHKAGVKVIHYVHDTDPLNKKSLDLSPGISIIVFNSKFTADHYKNEVKCPWEVIYPPIELSRYIVRSRQPEYITMINPVETKGAKILPEVIRAFPDEKFLLVLGWRKPEIDPAEYPNVTILERQYDMRTVYGKTKVLVVPSQWRETFGRVIPEAEINGIPIVASKIGGLPESVGNGGILVEEFSNPQAWVAILSQLLGSLELQLSLGQLGTIQARQFDGSIHFNRLREVLNRVDRK